jgi:glycosyltransferase involved in cell wall biosynthesis
VPVLDEAAGIVAALESLAPLRAAGNEVIVVDGGSADGSAELARPLCDRVVIAPRGRAAQMNAGAQEARGDVLLFLHADTRCPPGAPEAISQAMKTNMWGRFDVEIEGTHPLLKVVAWSMNLRASPASPPATRRSSCGATRSRVSRRSRSWRTSPSAAR